MFDQITWHHSLYKWTNKINYHKKKKKLTITPSLNQYSHQLIHVLVRVQLWILKPILRRTLYKQHPLVKVLLVPSREENS